jgi:ribonuclease J
MLNLTNPRYVMPIHGDHKRLHLHAKLAEAVGVDPEDTFKGKNGRPLEIDESGARFGEDVQSGMIFVDGLEVGDIEDVALRDRRALSADGIFIVVATISGQDGRSLADPEVIFRGVPFMGDEDGIVDEIRATVDASLAQAARDEVREITLLQENLREDVAEFVYERLRRRPMVLPVVVEV